MIRWLRNTAVVLGAFATVVLAVGCGASDPEPASPATAAVTTNDTNDASAPSGDAPESDLAAVPDQPAPSFEEPPETGDAAVSGDVAVSDDAAAANDAVVFGDEFPEVLAVDAGRGSGQSWTFSVTLSSLYDTPERYADAWRVLDADDTELGIRVLGHDHAGEQPFTRSGTVEIPDGTAIVWVEGRDQANGWSGQRFEFQLPAS